MFLWMKTIRFRGICTRKTNDLCLQFNDFHFRTCAIQLVSHFYVCRQFSLYQIIPGDKLLDVEKSACMINKSEDLLCFFLCQSPMFFCLIYSFAFIQSVFAGLAVSGFVRFHLGEETAAPQIRVLRQRLPRLKFLIHNKGCIQKCLRIVAT